MNKGDWNNFYQGQTRGRTVLPFSNREWSPTEHRNNHFGIQTNTMNELYPSRKISSVNSYKPKTPAQVSTDNYPNNYAEYITIRDFIKNKLELKFNLSINLRKSWVLEKEKDMAKQEYLRAVEVKENVEEKRKIKVNAGKIYKAANRELLKVIELANLEETKLNNIFIINKGYLQTATNNSLVEEIKEDIMKEISSSYSSGGYKSVKRVVKRPVKKVAKRPTKKPVKKPTTVRTKRPAKPSAKPAKPSAKPAKRPVRK